MEAELVKVLDQCPEEEVWPQDDPVMEKIQSIEQKIDRLVSALAESSSVAEGYISKEIEKLDQERERILVRDKGKEKASWSIFELDVIKKCQTNIELKGPCGKNQRILPLVTRETKGTCCGIE